MPTTGPKRAHSDELPTLSVGPHPAEGSPCGICGEPVALGFEAGHAQFAHHIRAAGRQPNAVPAKGESAHRKRPDLFSFVLFLPAAGTTLWLVYLAASWITNNGHSVLGIHATTHTAQLLVIVVTAGFLLAPATPVFMAVTFVELAFVALLSAMPGATRRVLHRNARPVPFDRLYPFTFQVHYRSLTARYTLRPNEGRLDWRFCFEQEPSDPNAVDRFVHATGPAIEAALGLPPELRRYKPLMTPAAAGPGKASAFRA